jgi:hypothetical protein
MFLLAGGVLALIILPPVWVLAQDFSEKASKAVWKGCFNKVISQAFFDQVLKIA